jgi:hypothetical protein
MKRLLGGKKRKGLLALLGLGATVYARHRTGTSPSYWNTHNRPT